MLSYHFNNRLLKKIKKERKREEKGLNKYETNKMRTELLRNTSRSHNKKKKTPSLYTVIFLVAVKKKGKYLHEHHLSNQRN